MKPRHLRDDVFVSAALLALSACGGGNAGTQFVPLAPTTPVSPPASPSAARTVTIFQNPSPIEYASVGGSMTMVGATPSSRFGALSTADADEPHIRYSSRGFYEIALPGKDWDTLVPHKGLANPTADNTSFQPASAVQNAAWFNTVTARWAGYVYSEYAVWGSRESDRSGWLGFGIPTPAGGTPATGSATYQGSVQGSADIMQYDGLARTYFPAGVDGKVTLKFDFQQGGLTGAMDLFLQGAVDPISIGSFSFKDSVFAAGSTSYAGRFDTNLGGSNYFIGRFTGPHAEETIGAWAIPFSFTRGDASTPPDGQLHQAFGAWVAKQ
jgi:hypothetical protein